MLARLQSDFILSVCMILSLYDASTLAFSSTRIFSIQRNQKQQQQHQQSSSIKSQLPYPSFVQQLLSKKNNNIDSDMLSKGTTDTGISTVMSRRNVLLTTGIGACGLCTGLQELSPSTAYAADTPPTSDMASAFNNIIAPQAESIGYETGLLESRVTGNALNPPPYGMERPDVYYPSWFSGVWKVSSTTKDIQAPCGLALFGGNNTYNIAREEIGTSLVYESRFIPMSIAPTTTTTSNNNAVIADREFNVKSIAKASMGENSVVDISLATPNKFSCLLAPKGSPSLLNVDLLVLNRRQEIISDTKFDCSEVVREIVSSADNKKPKQLQMQQQPAILKEIETTSLYTYYPDKDEVHCQQRSATFLLPSNENLMAMKMWQASRGRAIDVRYYDVVYKRK